MGYGLVRLGVVSMVRYGGVWYGLVRYCKVRYGEVGCGFYGVVRWGTVRFGMVRYCKVRYGVVFMESNRNLYPFINQ